MSIKPANRIRRFDVFAEYRKQEEQDKGMASVRLRQRPGRADGGSGTCSAASPKRIGSLISKSSSAWVKTSTRTCSFRRYVASASKATRMNRCVIESVGAGVSDITFMRQRLRATEYDAFVSDRSTGRVQVPR